MILEIDTSILERIENLSINQLVFLTLVLNDNQTINQDIQRLLSLVNEEEIQELENQGLITITKSDSSQCAVQKCSIGELGTWHSPYGKRMSPCRYSGSGVSYRRQCCMDCVSLYKNYSRTRPHSTPTATL